jgi:hypothetical protein
MRGLDCPMQEMVTLELTTKGDPWRGVPAHVQGDKGVEYMLH